MHLLKTIFIRCTGTSHSKSSWIPTFFLVNRLGSLNIFPSERLLHVFERLDILQQSIINYQEKLFPDVSYDLEYVLLYDDGDATLFDKSKDDVKCGGNPFVTFLTTEQTQIDKI